MITRSHFTRIADAHGVDAKTVERDYVLTHAVAAISRHSADRGLVFKGGTALRLCYFEEYRYSADLDFSLRDGTDLDAALECIQTALADVVSDLDFPYLAVADDGKRIEYEGPLRRSRDLKLDIAIDELVEDTTERSLLFRYPDQTDARASVYTLGEIGAEKLRCVIQRLQARDLFDLNEIFVVNRLEPEEIWPTFERKSRYKEIDPAQFRERFEMRIPQWRSRWDSEMREHLGGELDPFDAVERAVRRALRTLLREH
ncbi:MAG: nucleotidyl transferase AbiEii/AbiGii toxin family protein [Solirubrobacteraceae bacterium]